MAPSTILEQDEIKNSSFEVILQSSLVYAHLVPLPIAFGCSLVGTKRGNEGIVREDHFGQLKQAQDGRVFALLKRPSFTILQETHRHTHKHRLTP